jgi:pimeloyl-ACP methyl ester carboxylesterase
MKRKHLLLLLIPLILFSGCQDEDSSLKTSPQREFDPIIVKTLEAYGLHPSDFEDHQVLKGDRNLSVARHSPVATKTLTVGNETITYYETSGRGPDVLLVHGNSMSSNSYFFQLNSVLGKVFHIISVDLPGHGASQNSPDPAVTYQLPGYADLLVDVIDELGMEQAVMVGWSLGGNILLEASDRLTQTPGIMIFDCAPIANPFNPAAFLPTPEFGLFFKPDLTEEEVQALVPIIFRPGIPFIPEVFYDDVRRQDPNARLYLGVTVGTGNYTDQVGIVGNLSVPLAVLDGKEEQISSIAWQKSLTIPTLWHHKVWEIPRAGHIAQWENPLHFNVLLAAFVIDCNIGD